MNASAQARSIGVVSKIASIPILVRAEFPGAIADLNPWLDDPATQQQHDPLSIDFGFSFRQWHPELFCNCVLLQLQMSQDVAHVSCRLAGITATGHGQHGQHWQFSSSADWQFVGEHLPAPIAQERLLHIFNQILILFHYPAAILH
ncbi:MAG: hypothetical protein AAGF24_02580 [Cyanobacteria bacterium P01_H01_bin.121]